MTELVRPAGREPIYIAIPAALCEVVECENARQFDMLVLFLNESRIEIFQVCGRCAFLWKGFAPANFFPLNKTPSLPWVVQQVEQELIRRRPPQPVHYNVFSNMNMGTGTGNVYFRFQ